MLVNGHLRRALGILLALALIGVTALPAAAQDDPPVSSVNGAPITHGAFEGASGSCAGSTSRSWKNSTN